jgi:hypothetical protein
MCAMARRAKWWGSKLLFAAILVALSIAVKAQPEGLAFDVDLYGISIVWSPVQSNGCQYTLFNSKADYATAANTCRAVGNGATLASPQTASSAQFVGSLESSRGSPRWLSGMYTKQEGWSSRTSSPGYGFKVSQFAGWYPGEPNDPKVGACLQQGYEKAKIDVEPWRFNDAPCSKKTKFVCQRCGANAQVPAPVKTTEPSNTGGNNPAIVLSCTLACSTLGWPIGSPGVCGQSEFFGSCHMASTWNEAHDVCTAVGARLCTAIELQADAVGHQLHIIIICLFVSCD